MYKRQDFATLGFSAIISLLILFLRFLVLSQILDVYKRQGKDDMPGEAERKGLGTPATRAAIIEKLVTAGFVERTGKRLIPTKAGINPVSYTHLDVYKRQECRLAGSMSANSPRPRGRNPILAFSAAGRCV